MKMKRGKMNTLELSRMHLPRCVCVCVCVCHFHKYKKKREKKTVAIGITIINEEEMAKEMKR